MAEATGTDAVAQEPAPQNTDLAAPTMNGGAIIASQLGTMLVQVGKTVTDRTAEVRRTCDLIDQTLAEDAERIKGELSGYVAAAEAMARQADATQRLLDEMRAKRARRIS